MFKTYSISCDDRSWRLFTVTVVDDDFIETIIVDTSQHHGEPVVEKVLAEAVIQVYNKRNLNVALNLFYALRKASPHYSIRKFYFQIIHCMAVPSFEPFREKVEKHHQRLLNLKAFW